MEFATVVRRRRMVRNYDPGRPVPPAVVERLLEHAIRAPSAGFAQGWAFLVLETPADRDRFWAATTPPATAATTPPATAATTPPATAATTPPATAVATPPATAVAGPNPWLEGMRRAPLIVVPHSNRDAYLDRYAEPDKGWTDRDEGRWPVPYWHLDAGMAALLILLTAVDAGLGACLFGIPPGQTAGYRAAFGVPVAFTPIGAVTVGYPAPDRRSPSLRRGRRPVDDVVHRGRWD